MKITDADFVVIGEPRWKKHWRRWQPKIVLALQFAGAFVLACLVRLLSKSLNGH